MRHLIISMFTILFFGCAPDPVEVRPGSGETTSYGHEELNEASDELAATPTSPKAFAAFASRLAALKTTFAEHVANQAERRLVFAAIEPLVALYGKSDQEQFETLALTVWPAALRDKPKKGEDPWEYAARLCSGPLALDCKYVVREHWPVMLNALVWERFKERARSSYSVCGACKKDPSFVAIIERYEEYEGKIGARAAILKSRSHPRQWPYSGDKAQPWPTDVLLLEFLGDGSVELAGESLGGAWRHMIGERRGGSDTLGLHLRPTEDVRYLRSILAQIKRAGFGKVVLQVREPKFPYHRKAYHLLLDGKPLKVSVQEDDSIQVLVQALDIAG